MGGRRVDLHVSRDHLGRGVLVQFELGQCIGRPCALFLRSPPFRLRVCKGLFELILQPTNLIPQRRLEGGCPTPILLSVFRRWRTSRQQRRS